MNEINGHVVVKKDGFWDRLLIKQKGFLKVLWGADDDLESNGRMHFSECFPFGSLEEIKCWAKDMYCGWGYEKICFYKEKYERGKHFDVLRLSGLRDNRDKLNKTDRDFERVLEKKLVGVVK